MPKLKLGIEKLEGKLKERDIKEAVKPGLYSDGNGLYLRVAPKSKKRGSISKGWMFKFMIGGRARSMGLGPVSLYSLQAARAMALDARKLRHQGIDPIEARLAKDMQERLEAAKQKTFDQCAAEYIRSHKAGWKNSKNAAQWESSLRNYAGPFIGALPVGDIDTNAVMRVLRQPVEGETFWTARPETASRVRGRIESVFDLAKTQGIAKGENPAKWKGHLNHLLPATSKVHKVEHHPALPYRELPAFMAELRAREGISARAFEFTILTCARTGEALGAKWGEVDLGARVWTIPGERMKGGLEHRVPLCAQALAILLDMRLLAPEGGADAYVFPGFKHGRPLGNMAFLTLLRRMGRHGDLTGHGFRATAKTWAEEETPFPSKVIEKALAHKIGGELEEAYNRGDLFQKRRGLMDAWAAYCGSGEAADNVVELRGAR